MTASLSQAARNAAGRVDEARLWQRVMDMAAFGARADGGVNRPALSKADRQARAQLIEWGAALGLVASLDDAANLFLTRAGTEDGAPVVAGSHLDSQPAGGKFDGAYGVLAALEAVQAMNEARVETRLPIEIVAWTNEEGGRFAPSYTGSMPWSGHRLLSDFLDVCDSDGVRYADALAATLAATPDLPRRPFRRPVTAYVEPHIEQGPLLEQAGLEVGVVTGIQGVRWFTVTVHGRTAHAGTTPLRLREDALQGALRALNALNAAFEDPKDVLRFTIGRVRVEPNTPNAVPDRFTFTIDLRHPDARALRELGDSIADVVERAVAPLSVSIEETLSMAPSVFRGEMVALIARSAKGLGLRTMRLASGAFHDAMFANLRCPAGMIFVPCRNGLSHHPDEYAEPKALAEGARVLTATLVELAGPA